MAHHLTGWTAIAFAEKHGGTLKKYRDPTERALKRVSIDKAKQVAREDSRLIYMDVPSAKYGRSNPARRKRSTKRKNPTQSVSLKNFTGKIMRGADNVVRILGLSK